MLLIVYIVNMKLSKLRIMVLWVLGSLRVRALVGCQHANLLLLLLAACHTAGDAFAVVGDQELKLRVQPGSSVFRLEAQPLRPQGNAGAGREPGQLNTQVRAPCLCGAPCCMSV